MRKRIVIAVTNNLQTDQRVFRISRTLIKESYEVSLVGRQFGAKVGSRFPAPTKLFNLWFNKGALFYANYNIRFFFYLLFKPYDIVLANDLDTLPAAFYASKLRRKQVVYDSHEYFTEVPELINKKFQKKIWIGFEKRIIPKLKYTYTVCQSIANEYNKLYQSHFKVIRNLPTKKTKFWGNVSNKSILIYQGALQQSRGLELMIETMQYLNNTELWIIGRGYWEKNLKDLANQLKVEDKVQFLGAFSPKDLAKITPQASIGLSIEENIGLSYQYALPNKLFDYIQAQIPVIVSNLPEMKNIVDSYQVGNILVDRSAKNLANTIKTMLNDKAQLEVWKSNLKKASQELNWENESKILLQIFKEIEQESNK